LQGLIEIILTIAIKVLLIFGPAVAATYWFFRFYQIEVIGALSLFFALVAAQVALWLGFLLHIPASNFYIFAIYWLALFGIVFGISRGEGTSFRTLQVKKRTPFTLLEFIEIVTLFVAFAVYYGVSSRGIPASGGMYFFHLDLLKFTQETGQFYPALPKQLTFTNYMLTIFSAHYGILVLLASGHVVTYGLLHGVYVYGFLLVLTAIARELWGSRYWGYPLFVLLFVGVHGVINAVYSNMYLTIPTKETTTYFLLGLIAFLLIRIFRQEPKARDLALLLLAALFTAIARPYTIPFLASFTLVCIIYYARVNSWAGLATFMRSKAPFFLCITPFIIFLNVSNLLKFGSPFPIGRVHQHYAAVSTTSAFSQNMIETVRLFLHYYFPYLEAMLFRTAPQKAYFLNEITLLISLLSAIGLTMVIVRIVSWVRESKESYFFLSLIGLATTFILTVWVLVPKNRMFYWATPFVLACAGEGLRGIVGTKWKVIVPSIATLVVIISLTPSPRGFWDSISKGMRIRLPIGNNSKYFRGSQEHMRLVKGAISRYPEGRVMVTGIEPGLDDLVLAPGRYYWKALALPQQVEQDFDRVAWDWKECIDLLRNYKVRVISISVPPHARIPFMSKEENGHRFWELLAGNPGVFRKVGSPKGYYHYRSVYEVLYDQSI
jgi:hypothetical protein